MKRRSFLAAFLSAPALPAAGAILTNMGDAQKERAKADTRPASDDHLPLRSANIGQVASGIIRSGDGRMVFDLAGGAIRIS